MELKDWILDKKKESKPISYRKYLVATILIALVATTFVTVFAFYYNGVGTKALPDSLIKLDVTILPRECKLYPGETQVFTANVYNGTAPFTYNWQSNGTSLGDTPSIEFSFTEPCDYTLLSVMVWDSEFGFGYDSVLVYDPAFESRAKYIEAPMPYSAIVECNSTHTAWYNGTTCQRMELSTNASAILQACHDALPTDEGGVIYIKPPLLADGQLIITKNHTSIVTDLKADYYDATGATGVNIRQIKIDASAEKVRMLFFQGISFREIHFFANGNRITEVDFIDCSLWADATYKGIIIEGDGTVDGWLMNIYFVRNYIRFFEGVTDSIVTWKNCQHVTEIYFDKCCFCGYGATAKVLFRFAEDGPCDSLFITQPIFYMECPLTFFQIDARTVAYETGLGWLHLSGGRAEVHRDSTLFKVDTSGSYKRFSVYMHDVKWAVTPGKTLTVFDCPLRATQIWADAQNIDIHNNRFQGGTINLGVAPASTYTRFIFKDNPKLSPIGLIATPFYYGTGIRRVIHPSGDASAPTANIESQVMGSDIYLTSTGGTGVSINVTDLDGNFYISESSTLTREHIPRGYFVNFGNFTVAPTVTVYFE